MLRGNKEGGHGGFMGVFYLVRILHVIGVFLFVLFLLWEGSSEGKDLGVLPLPPSGLQCFKGKCLYCGYRSSYLLFK